MRYLLLSILLLSGWLRAAEKVVSLSPAVTELIFYAGGEKQLCGRSSACGVIGKARHIPVAGDMGKPSVEAVLKKRATLVISDCSHPQAQWDMLKRCGVKVELLSNSSIDDLPANLRTIGKLLDLPGAESLAQQLSADIRDLKKSRPAVRKRAVVLFWSSPLISCGKDTYIDSALKLAGVENAAASAGNGYFIVNPELLIAVRPEILIFIGVPETLADALLQKRVFHSLRSCRRIFLDSEKWSRLTPGLPEAVGGLKRIIQQN